MRKIGAISLFLMLTFISLVSAQFYGTFSASNFLNSIDDSTLILGIIFIVSFALLNFSLSKWLKGNKAISATVALAISLLIVWSVNKSGISYNLFFYDIFFFIPSGFLETVLPWLFIIGTLFIGFMWGWNKVLLILGVILLITSIFAYESGIVLGLGIILIAIWLVLIILSKKKDIGSRYRPSRRSIFSGSPSKSYLYPGFSATGPSRPAPASSRSQTERFDTRQREQEKAAKAERKRSKQQQEAKEFEELEKEKAQAKQKQEERRIRDVEALKKRAKWAGGKIKEGGIFLGRKGLKVGRKWTRSDEKYRKMMAEEQKRKEELREAINKKWGKRQSKDEEMRQKMAQEKAQKEEEWKAARHQARNKMTQIRNQISHLQVAAVKAPSVMERGRIEDQIRRLKKEAKKLSKV